MDIKVPEIGESIVEAIVGEWQKNTGDQVAVDDLLALLRQIRQHVFFSSAQQEWAQGACDS